MLLYTTVGRNVERFIFSCLLTLCEWGGGGEHRGRVKVVVKCSRMVRPDIKKKEGINLFVRSKIISFFSADSFNFVESLSSCRSEMFII